MANRILLIERVIVPGMTGERGARVLAEKTALDKYGLSHEHFLAAVNADLGVAGVVNLNRRIYQPCEWVPENVKLGVRAAHEFVKAERDHPEFGPTLNVAARIVRVEVTDAQGQIITLEQSADGTWRLPLGEDAKPKAWPKIARARGVLAFTRTTDGQDLWILHQAGMALGTSSRGFGLEDQVEIGEDSPWAEFNQDFQGQRVGVVKEYELVTYDVVDSPSAGTFVHTLAPQSEARRAYLALAERHHLPAPEPAGGSISTGAAPMNLQELMAKYPDLVKEIGEKALAEAKTKNPLLAKIEGLDDKRGALLATLLAGLEGQAPGAEPPKDGELADQIKRLADATDRGNARQTQLETSIQTLQRTINEEKTKREAAEATLAAKVLREAITAELALHLEKVHSKLRDEVKGWVEEEIEAGRVAKVEDVAPLVERVSKRLQKVAVEGAPANAGPGAGGGGAGAGDGTPPKAPTPPTPPSPDLLDDAFGSVFGGDWKEKLAEQLGRQPAAPTPPAQK